MHGTPYIICAPSGAGKTSLVGKITAEIPNLMVSISHTTRPKRPGEQDGVNYHFVDQKKFDELVNADVFLEHAKVFNYSYGTSKLWVEEKLKQGIDVILEIDWQGAQQIRKIFPKVISIFIFPPDLSTLKKRLTDRGQDDEATIKRRLSEAQHEMNHFHEFNYLVINDKFDHAVQDLTTIIQANRLSTPVQAIQQRTLIQQILA